MNRPLDEVEALLRRELVPSRYAAAAEAEATLAEVTLAELTLAEVTRRVDRGRRLRQTATAAAAATLVAAVVTAVALLAGPSLPAEAPARS
ncbi:hypothetical protein ABZS66_57385, partial [Dactylosporangium sp. NPDC005572]|uniref:hypothetical protein n=1 Tax=Dactylosporangium sp. NPDC005572 TaxID=3156889 RepID=UPI0033B73D56